MTTLRLHSVLLSAALIAGASCLSPMAAPRALQEVASPFPTPSQGLVIRGQPSNGAQSDQTLLDLLRDFESVTGEHLVIANDSRSILSATRSGLMQDLEVAPEEVYTVVETVLIANHFAVTDLRRGATRMMAVSSLNSPMRATVRSAARFVPSEELATYEDHPALLIQTVVSFDHLDLRALSNSMRAMVVDPNTLQLIPVPESRSLILVGFGPALNDITRTLQALDSRVSERMAERNQPEPEQG